MKFTLIVHQTSASHDDKTSLWLPPSFLPVSDDKRGAKMRRKPLEKRVRVFHDSLNCLHESLYTFHTLSTCKVGSPGKAHDRFITSVTHCAEIHTLHNSGTFWYLDSNFFTCLNIVLAFGFMMLWRHCIALVPNASNGYFEPFINNVMSMSCEKIDQWGMLPSEFYLEEVCYRKSL